MSTDLAQLVAPERNRYFYGLLMDAERFQRDQDYFNRKRYVLNRSVTGSGVVSGLGLTFTPPINTKGGSMLLSPGIALDFLGREIIVAQPTPVDIYNLTDVNGKPSGPTPAGATILISIAYAERKTDLVPVLVPDCDNPGRCAPSAIAESFVVLVRTVTTPPPAIPGCVFGTFPLPPGAPLQLDIANQIAGAYQPPPSDVSVALGRMTLPAGQLDAASDRPIVYNNNLLYQMLFCLAAQVAQSTAMTLIYELGDNQTAAAGAALANPLVVGVVDAQGNPVAGAPAPTFALTAGGGSVGAATNVAPGKFQALWTLGPAGVQTVTARIAQSNVVVTFQATIHP